LWLAAEATMVRLAVEQSAWFFVVFYARLIFSQIPVAHIGENQTACYTTNATLLAMTNSTDCLQLMHHSKMCADHDNQTECEVLVELARDLHIHAPKWLQQDPIPLIDTDTGLPVKWSFCDWYGVECKPARHPRTNAVLTSSQMLEDETLPRAQVTKLQLPHHKLYGTITDNIVKLYELQWLNLDSNDITGTLPPLTKILDTGNVIVESRQRDTGSGAISVDRIVTNFYNYTIRMQHLERLIMGYNRLEGEIPDLTQGSKLRYLMLQNNNLSSTIPETLSDLSDLQWLSLSDNMLNGTVPKLDKLLRLQAMWIGNNELDGEVPSVAYNQELQFIDVRNNEFTGLNQGICNLSYGFFRDEAIRRCHVSDNPIQCDKFPTCARDGCDASICMNGTKPMYFEFGKPRPESSTPTPRSTRPPVVYIEGQPIQGSMRDSIALTSPISEGVDNRRQY
jgi:hypothetical protein